MDDDYDPLAPVHVGASPADPSSPSERPEPYSDAARIVRLWFDNADLVRVAISPIWHLKVGPRRLDQVFNSVLAAARVRIAPPAPPPVEPDLSHVDFSGIMRFGNDPFTTFQLALENVDRRWQEAAERQLQRDIVPPKPISMSDDGITVRLDEQGLFSSVEFDEDYLDDADVSEIGRNIIRLTRRARAHFVPLSTPRDELAEIALEHEILMAGLRAMLTGRSPQ